MTYQFNLDQSSQPLKIHAVGIKGVGVSSLAIILKQIGHTVEGSDTAEIQITDTSLSQAQIPVAEFESVELNPDYDLIIYSGAYNPTSNPVLKQARQLELTTLSLAEATAALLHKRKLICVCGVGGKTTTSSMLAYGLKSNSEVGYLVGVSQLTDSEPAARWGNETGYFIIEADEYAIDPPEDTRPKFDLYQPEIVICTHLAYDHPDIYQDFDQTLDTFASLFNRIPKSGCLIINQEDYNLIKDRLSDQVEVVILKVTTRHERASISETEADQAEAYPQFDPDTSTLNLDDQNKHDLQLKTIGQVNQLNAALASVAVVKADLNLVSFLEQLKDFSGVKRRQELIKQEAGVTYFDDYGHHPDEIKLTLEAIAQAFPDKRLIVVFHPHTLSRTKKLLTEFALAFNLADQVLVAPIFASAREVDDQSISSEVLANEIKNRGTQAQAYSDFETIINRLKQVRRRGDLILTLGAGDIYKIHQYL